MLSRSLASSWRTAGSTSPGPVPVLLVVMGAHFMG
jgi:hypothetical protein